jgi:exopolysaccharide biosynthesis protein
MSASITAIKRLFALILIASAIAPGHAGVVLGPWTPIFKGIDLAKGTNTPSASGMPDLQVAYIARVDLTDPDVQFMTTPRIKSFALDQEETAGLTMGNFLVTNNLQLAVDGGYFYIPSQGFNSSPDYLAPQGTPFVLSGLFMSKGQVIVPQEGPPNFCSTILFSANNQATVVHNNWPARPTTGVYTAVSGYYPLVINGVNIGRSYLSSSDFVHQINPRTAFGVSQDGHYLYIVTIDGRQSGYSDGALDWETGAWMTMIGVYNGVNMDGGGSTTLTIADSTGKPVDINHSNAKAANGVDRTVGSHFGVYAKPVPGFINDVAANPDDTAATITWSTLDPSTSQVRYGTNLSLGLSTALSTNLSTNHAALLTGLVPATEYYYQVVSSENGGAHVSSNFAFVTTNYVVTSDLFGVTNEWTYTDTDLDGVNWTAPSYDDSAWPGTGPGLLWVDIRGPNPLVTPENTEMPPDPSTGYPYITYYFRTHFTFTNPPSGVTLLFNAYVDDGAVFYLNGKEIYRLRMPAAPTKIVNDMLSIGYPCSGDATCPDNFTVSGAPAANLVTGDNVLAVEVHNYNAASPDITFGTGLGFTEPLVVRPRLAVAATNDAATLSWTRGGFTLQQANSLDGSWSNAPGPVVSSPYITPFTNPAAFYRLKK